MVELLTLSSRQFRVTRLKYFDAAHWTMGSKHRSRVELPILPSTVACHNFTIYIKGSWEFYEFKYFNEIMLSVMCPTKLLIPIEQIMHYRSQMWLWELLKNVAKHCTFRKQAFHTLKWIIIIILGRQTSPCSEVSPGVAGNFMDNW